MRRRVDALQRRLLLVALLVRRVSLELLHAYLTRRARTAVEWQRRGGLWSVRLPHASHPPEHWAQRFLQVQSLA